MNEPETTQERTPSTAQIAAAGTAAADDRTGPGQSPFVDMPAEQPVSDSPPDQLSDSPADQPAAATQAAAGSVPGTGGNAHAQLLEDDELQRIHAQWKDIQAAFVDEPRKAVQDADTLVADLMQRLAQMFASERSQLEARWSSGDDVSTEDLRHGLRRYRSFFERLLAA